MSTKKWAPDEYSIASAIRDGYHRECSFTDSGHVQRIRVEDDGTAHVDWYGPSQSAKSHWHFVFKLQENGKVVPGSGRLVHD